MSLRSFTKNGIDLIDFSQLIFLTLLQRQTKLQGHLASLRDMEDLLEELMAWLKKCEDELTTLEAEPLPDDLGQIQVLIKVKS